MKKEGVGILEVVFAQFLIAFIYILVKLGDSFGVYNLAFFRVMLAAFFIGLLFMFSKKFKLSKIKKEKAKLLLFGALHGIVIIAAFISIKYISLAMAVLLFCTLSIWVVVFSHFMLREKISRRVILALILSFFGAVILVNPADLFMKTSLIGILAGLFVGVGGGFIYTLSKTFKNYDKISLTFWQNIIAIPFLIPLLFLQTPVFTLSNSIIALSMGFIGALSFILMYVGFGFIKGQKGGILTLLNVVFTIILGFLIFREIPQIREIIGGLLILIGSYIVSSGK